MNVGKDNRHPIYICDKCGNTIFYYRQKGFKGLNKYYKQKPASNPPKKNFDLCDNCEKKFREWLNIKEIPTIVEVIGTFPKYTGEWRKYGKQSNS